MAKKRKPRAQKKSSLQDNNPPSAITNHDQRFKTLIREFFVEFLLLFFTEWATLMDLSAIEWLDKEIFHYPPEGSRREVDLVAKLPVLLPVLEEVKTTSTTSLLLVHIEIESPDRTTALKPRLPFYYHFLREKYELPVLPIVIYLQVGLDGIGIDTYVERVWTLEVNRFQYLYVGLPGLDGIQYVEGDNWLGVALSALMKIPPEQVAWLGAEALRRLAGAPLTDEQKFLLAECVQAYLPLDEQQQQNFDQLLQTGSYEEVKAMNQTVYEQGIEKGIEKGRREGQLELVCSLLEDRFGRLSEKNQYDLKKLSIAKLRHLALKIGTVSSLSELGLQSSNDT